MRPVLTPGGWHRACLGSDDEALAWLADLERGNDGSVVSAELLDEGVIRYRQLLNVKCASDAIYSSSSCPRGADLLTVRRRWTGPVPPQVLAAFEPTEELVS